MKTASFHGTAVSFLLALTFAGSALGCRSHPADKDAAAIPQAERVPAPAASAVATDAGSGGSDDAGSGARDAGAQVTGPQASDVLEGATFEPQVKAAFRVAACSGDDAWIPAHVDRALVDKHCALLKSNFEEYDREWMKVAKPFIARLRPEGLPNEVVYPFGGGDLVSALATYPDATQVTTVSLEVAGDVRGIDKADKRRLGKELATLRDHLGKLFLKAHSRTENLDIETHGAVPGEVAFTMAALAIHGFEPVTLRYFRFEPDGQIHWLSLEEIEKNATKPGRASSFSNAEIRFRKPGDARVRILRHVAYDLSNEALARAPGLLRHLEGKPKVSTMTKAASHLLWDDAHFSVIREWLMTHTDWMISDTTGVPPRIAKKYGFVQDTFGLYVWPEPFGTVNNADAKAFQELYKGGTALPFRYGYPDNKSHGHILVTRKPELRPKAQP